MSHPDSFKHFGGKCCGTCKHYRTTTPFINGWCAFDTSYRKYCTYNIEDDEKLLAWRKDHTVISFSLCDNWERRTN